MHPNPEQRGAAGIVLALGLVSGAVGLAYEVVWTRELINLLGSTTTASAATLAAFMAGIALGAWLTGQWSERVREPLWLYALAEGGLAVIGLSFPHLLGALAETVTGAATFAVLVSILLVPTVLMGVALPALAATLQRCGAVDLRYLAWLYGLNTLGGVAAVLGAGFGALPAFGVAATGQAAAVAGIITAVAAAAISLGLRPAVGVGARLETRPARAARAAWRVSGFGLGAALFLSGIAALGYEVLWTRILVLVVGSSTNAFTLMLALYLLGLAVGGIWIGRRLSRLARPAATFQHLQLGVAGAAIAGGALFGALPGLALRGFSLFGTSPGVVAAVDAVLAAIIILPPTAVIGASLPVAARLLQRRTPQRGHELGAALGLVTAGNVVGVLATAFAVIPAVGLQRGVVLLAVVNLAAALLLWIGESRRAGRRRWPVPAAALAALVAAALVPSWDRAMMTSGVFRRAPVYLALLGSPGRLERVFSAYKTRYYREGKEAVVAVFDRPTLSGTAHRFLVIDGKVDASTGADMATQILSGHLPFLFRADPRRVLVLGLASGVSVGSLLEHPVKKIDVVEIEPAVLAAAREFNSVNGRTMSDPRVRFIIDDGRRYLRSSTARYDIIVSEPSNPWLSMSARLFTRKFFELARGRLAANGVLVQWVPLYGLSGGQFRALLRTLISVFPNVSLFRVAKGDLVAVAGTRPLPMQPKLLAALFKRNEVIGSLQRAGIRTPVDLAARMVADQTGLRAVLGAGRLNTDDNGFLEFGSPWYLLENTRRTNLVTLRKFSASSVFARIVTRNFLPTTGGLELLQLLAERQIAKGSFRLAGDYAKSLRAQGQAKVADLLLGDIASARGRWTEARRLWQRNRGPQSKVRLARMAFRLGRTEEVIRYFDRLSPAVRSGSDTLRYALALSAAGQPGKAMNLLDTIPDMPLTAAGLVGLHVNALLCEKKGESGRAARLRNRLNQRLADLRRCLELDGCRDVMGATLRWAREVPKGMSPDGWGQLRQDLFLSVIRPIPHYFRGVTRLWLGDYGAAARSFATYLQLLPKSDRRSRAHALMKRAKALAASKSAQAHR